MSKLSRRSLLKKSGVLAMAPLLPASALAERKKAKHQFSFCLNTSTIRGQNLNLTDEIKTAAAAGYDGIEIWMSKLREHLEKGGTNQQILQLSKDLNIRIENCISFPQWIVDDEPTRNKAYVQAREEMELLAEIGCQRIAAPPAGATKPPSLDLNNVAIRYRKLLDIGKETGVLPQLELWGFSHNLHRFGEVIYAVAEAAHPDSCILPDVYHLYKGGSAFEGLRILDQSAIQMFHINDYPDNPGRQDIADKDRVFPGDGVAPMKTILQLLHDKNRPIVLSLELFNEAYYQRPALEVAKEGLMKMKKVVEEAVG